VREEREAVDSSCTALSGKHVFSQSVNVVRLPIATIEEGPDVPPSSLDRIRMLAAPLIDEGDGVVHGVVHESFVRQVAV
jgi:hypothetical protein